MAIDLITLDVRTRAGWRRWLAKNHAASRGVWLLRHKRHTGVESMSHEELVREALCYGWVDSLVKRVDENRFAIKVTPRKPTSKWSDSNRRRWKELRAEGLLAPPGLAAAPAAATVASKEPIPELPTYIAKALEANPAARQFFRSLPRSERRHFVAWIHTAKRSETRERRIRESIELLSAGKRLGLK